MRVAARTFWATKGTALYRAHKRGTLGDDGRVVVIGVVVRGARVVVRYTQGARWEEPAGSEPHARRRRHGGGDHHRLQHRRAVAGHVALAACPPLARKTRARAAGQ